MKKLNKLMVLVVGAMLVISMAAYAKTVTNTMGQVIVVGTHDENASDAADLTVIQDQSTYATMDSRQGLLVGYYDVEKFGGTNALLGITIPAGAILGDAIIDVTVAFTPAGATNALWYKGVGVTSIVSAAEAARAVGITTNIDSRKTTVAEQMYIDCTSSKAVTQGVFTVYQPYILALP